MPVGVLQKLTLPKSECKEYRKHKTTTQPKKQISVLVLLLISHHFTDDDELMLNVLRCHLTY